MCISVKSYERSKFSCGAGFSLTEVLVSILILSFLIAGLYGVLNIGTAVYYTDMGLLDLQQQARQAMDRMVKEIRQSNPTDVIITNPNTSNSTIQFKVPIDTTTDPITYSNYITYRLSSNQIIREYPAATTEVLANNVIYLSFFYVSDIVEIKSRASKTVQERTLCFPTPCNPAMFLTEKVRLRIQ